MKGNSYRIRLPAYFNTTDITFLDEILFHYQSFIGRTKTDFKSHLRMLYADDRLQWSRCLFVLKSLGRLEVKKKFDKKEMFELRKQAFIESAEHIREHTTSRVSLQNESIFEDLRAKLTSANLPQGLNSRGLLDEINLQVSKTALSKASKLRLQLSSNVRHVVSQAIKRGLMCVVISTHPIFIIEISGPLSVVRKTGIYGHSYLKLVPAIVKAKKFQILAFDFDLRQSPTLLQNGDPLPADFVDNQFDSRLEEQFVAGLSEKLIGWKIDREPIPLKIGEHWMFPDFLVTSPCGGHCWHIEIMGYTTKDYTEHKKNQLRAGLPSNFLFLISQRISKQFVEFTHSHKIIVFKKIIPVQEIVDKLSNDLKPRNSKMSLV